MCTFCQQPREIGSPLIWKFRELGPHFDPQHIIQGIPGKSLDLFAVLMCKMRFLDLSVLKFLSHVLMKQLSVSHNVGALPQSLWIPFIVFVHHPAAACFLQQQPISFFSFQKNCPQSTAVLALVGKLSDAIHTPDFFFFPVGSGCVYLCGSSFKMSALFAFLSLPCLPSSLPGSPGIMHPQ